MQSSLMTMLLFRLINVAYGRETASLTPMDFAVSLASRGNTSVLVKSFGQVGIYVMGLFRILKTWERNGTHIGWKAIPW